MDILLDSIYDNLLKNLKKNYTNILLFSIKSLVMISPRVRIAPLGLNALLTKHYNSRIYASSIDYKNSIFHNIPK